MRNLYLLLSFMTLFAFSCSKEDLNQNNGVNTSLNPTGRSQNISSSATIYNPIVGKWELGPFKILCVGATDTTTYMNGRGDYVEFRKNDTAYYTYNSTNATGWSPFKVLDATKFILGDTMRIISNDGDRLTTYTKSMNGGSQQWMTYIKVAN
jgi:hypothetical protein